MKTDPIDDESLEKILEAGRWAPSWANTQTWRFIVVRDNNIKNRLSEILSHNNPATDALRNSPITVVICSEMNRAGYRHGEPTTDKEGYWYMFDSGLAMQNMVLEAHSLGIGTVIVGNFDAKKAAEILEVPEGFCVTAMTPLGFPAEEARTPNRKELSEMVFNDKFGA
jgi:nitroreductase